VPRRRQYKEPDAIYHLIPRFVAGEWFIRGAEERRQYLRLFGLAISQSDWRCCSYAVMSSHIHLELHAGRDPLADWLRDAHTPFAEWINERNKRIGAVFVRGPKSFRVRDDGVAHVMGYIHRNPMRAGLVSDPRDSDWTSHAAYLGLVEKPAWLDTALGLERAGFANAADMDNWIRTTEIDRAAAKAALVKARRGRPKLIAANTAEATASRVLLPHLIQTSL
jgi:hypothetical protein